MKMYDPCVPWWSRELDDPDVGRSMLDTARDIDGRQVSIRDGNKRHARIYCGYTPSGMAGGVRASSMRAPFAATKALVRSVCDMAHALVVRNRPKASFVTTGADWQVQLQAEDLDQFMIGAFHAGGLYQTAPRSFHDSTIFGTGGWKYVTRGQGEKFRVVYERVLVDDLLVDEEECRVDCFAPPNVYHRMLVRTDAMIRKYGTEDSGKKYLLEASKNSPDGWPGMNVPLDHSVLVEGVHVDPEDPSRNRRVLAVNNVVVKSQVWPYSFQPYTFLWWTLPITGFYGDGIAYRQYGRQERVTYMHRWVQKVFDIFATPTAWVDPAGGPPVAQINDQLGKVILSRKQPSFQTQPLIQPEVYNWLNKLENDGFEDEGMNASMMSSAPPPGIESAPAQREAVWREGQRFFPVSQRWENAIAVETAAKTAAFYKVAAESGTKPKVAWADRKLMYSMEWPELDDSQYLIRPEASSLDSLSPSARMQSALELSQTGWISPEEGRALVAHPDLRASDDLGNAAENYAKWALRQLYHNFPLEVDERVEMNTVLRVVKQGRALALTRGVEDSAPEVLRNLNRFIDELDLAMKTAAEGAAQQMTMNQQPVAGLSGEAAAGSPVPFAG